MKSIYHVLINGKYIQYHPQKDNLTNLILYIYVYTYIIKQRI